MGAAVALAYAEAGARRVIADVDEARLEAHADLCRASGVDV
ncbi:hypothetical protein [Burkholderia sp. TSV86]|nr:hypothetical protein [Burkholderia sp. TSV86]